MNNSYTYHRYKRYIEKIAIITVEKEKVLDFINHFKEHLTKTIEELNTQPKISRKNAVVLINLIEIALCIQDSTDPITYGELLQELQYHHNNTKHFSVGEHGGIKNIS